MPPITLHNLPVPPREVAIAYKALDDYLNSFCVPDWDEPSHIVPAEMDCCILEYDSGETHSMGTRNMLIYADSDGYAFYVFASFEGTELKTATLYGDDDDEHRLIYPLEKAKA